MANFEKALAAIMFDILTGKTGHIGKATLRKMPSHWQEVLLKQREYQQLSFTTSYQS